ncbi:MAG: tetratricopeptide repeat protein [Bryobacteraceae bacterium]|nr:tetratricopeptide repeat protein [Bryobacteraceae bacterium]MDW8378757.1 tetratricopeptide repeat protein [Bryobacterales bacterium]
MPATSARLAAWMGSQKRMSCGTHHNSDRFQRRFGYNESWIKINVLLRLPKGFQAARVALALALMGGITRGLAAETGQLDANLTLFSVMAALNAAGFDADLQSCFNHPLRKQVRQQIAAKNPPSAFELKRFLRDHRLGDDAQTMALFVSFALVVEAPSFKYRVRENDVPPEVTALSGLQDLMKKFHQEAGIDELWKQAQPWIEKQLAAYHEPASRAVLEANGYLRNVTSGYLGRRFQIYLDLLGPPNQVHTRSYGDEFFVVITPSPEPQYEEIRHRYLQYLIDPLTLKYSEQIEKKKSILDLALAAPALPEIYKNDVTLLVQRCLVKAIEGRLMSGPGASEKRQQWVQQAAAEGFVLVPYFSEALAAYEKQEQALRLYFPEMIQGIDLRKEDKRFENFQFASAPFPRKPRHTCQQEEVVTPSGLDKTLEDAEKLLNARPRQIEEARKLFLSVLADTDEKAKRAKAYYGLARIATLEKNPELAERQFQRVLELDPDPFTKAWTLVYLGNLSDLAGEADRAREYYQAATAVEGASAKAREQADRGLKGEFRRKAQ